MKFSFVNAGGLTQNPACTPGQGPIYNGECPRVWAW